MTEINTWYCYILASTKILKNNNQCKSTYNGVTIDINKRLKQHNGLLSGGAKSTCSNRPWYYICIISGFDSKQEAMKCEWKIRTVIGKKRPSQYNGPDGRIMGLSKILKEEKFTNNCFRYTKDIKLNIYIDNKYKQHLENINEINSGFWNLTNIDNYFL
jgi:predicted GIY-YIG superfamily endonuclease